MQPAHRRSSLDVVFVLSNGVHLLDVAGPAQAFWALESAGVAVKITYVADDTVVRSAQGLDVSACRDITDIDKHALVIVPGWTTKMERSGRLSQRLLTLLAEHHQRGGDVASVCAGADALGRAGLLDGRRCTTHHGLVDALAHRYPRAEVVPDVLFVHDDRVHTSAGIASGIDLALSLIGERFGLAAAGRVARELVVFQRRNGDDSQMSTFLAHRDHLNDLVHRAQDIIAARFDESIQLGQLAKECHVAPRTLSRRFHDVVDMSPHRYQQLLRVEMATRLIEDGWTRERAARAVGYSDARALRRVLPQQHRKSS